MASVLCVIRLVEIECKRLRLRIREVIFIEDGFRDNVFFRGPGAEILEAAPVTAKREVRVLDGVRGFFANGASVSHGENKFYHRERRGATKGTGRPRFHATPRTNLERRSCATTTCDYLHQAKTRRGAPVEMRVSFSVGRAMGTTGKVRTGG